ncbi:MAG: hypothetical protein JKY43_05400 [Phycisphaerales bacterium]|nr:hypothetical protein [Phycisphaerales bacterium]
MELKINDRFENRKIKFFNRFSLNLVYNSIGSVFSFESYFDPDNIEHVELYAPSHFHECTLEHNGELLLTGTILSQGFGQSNKKQLVGLSGYSRPGVLEDCEIPTSSYPLQFDGLSLAQIARRLCAPFKIDVVIDDSVSSDMNKTFEVSTASESQNIKSYLADLAKQKDIILSHTEKGELLFTKANTDGAPILEFDTTKGSLPGTTFSFNFDGQGMHSHITLQKQASGGNAGEQTIRNPYVVGSFSFRPTVKSQSSGDDNDTGKAAQRALANELKGIKLSITMDRWVIDDKIIKPNNTITIIAPEIYIPRKETFFIESVKLSGDESKQTATLNCVLPSVYNGEKPVNIFRGINLHPLPDA